MPALTEKNLAVRNVVESGFAASFPRSFRALQDMALAGAAAYKNSGKRAWFGFGRDLSLESMRRFQDSVVLLVMSLHNEEFINLPAAKGRSEQEQVETAVKMFFIAYPNWQDAEAAWEIAGTRTVNVALRNLGY